VDILATRIALYGDGHVLQYLNSVCLYTNGQANFNCFGKCNRLSSPMLVNKHPRNFYGLSGTLLCRISFSVSVLSANTFITASQHPSRSHYSSVNISLYTCQPLLDLCKIGCVVAQPQLPSLGSPVSKGRQISYKSAQACVVHLLSVLEPYFFYYRM
jgi:hypothetical protein